MKKGLLYLTATVLIISVYGVLNIDLAETEYYSPRNVEHLSDSRKGAAEWLNSLRVNQITGKIDAQDVLDSRDQVVQSLRKGKKSSLGLQWEEMGPDDIGGRSRAIMFDKDDSNIMFAGAVSGGLFKSTNGGRSWQKVNDFADNLAVMSIAQTTNGDIYYGTGEGLYYFSSGTETQGLIGAGIYKSTDGGATFTQLTATAPAANSPGNAEWASIGRLIADPVDANRLYAATNRGLRMTTDGGTNWTNPLGSFTSAASELHVTATGKVYAQVGASIYYSATGDDGSYSVISGTDPGQIPSSGNRMTIASSPQDDDYVYVITTTAGGNFANAWQSKDGGTTFNIIGTASNVLNPHSGQGDYNNALGVSPIDKERIFVGGVTFWEWSASNGWLQVSSLNYTPTSTLYVHADNHVVTFDPQDPTEIWVANDGGLFKSSDNGVTWSWEVKNYITTQFYAVDYGLNGEIMGGTQDNGTILVDPRNVLSKSGFRTPSINFRGAFRDGDGGYASLSKLDPEILFKEMQYGVMGRSFDGGVTYSDFFDFDRIDPENQVGNASFSAFVTPFLLWENVNEPLSWDSIRFGADSAFTSVGFGNGNTIFAGNFKNQQASVDYVVEGLVISAGSQVITSKSDGTLEGDGTGTFDDATGSFNVTFNNPVSLEITAKCAIRFDAGSEVEIASATNELPIKYTLPTNLEPNESIMIQDPVQSMFFIGLRAFAPTGAANNPNQRGGIWMTRGALKNVTSAPEWVHIGTLNDGETAKTMAVSEDGDMLLVGTTNGRLYRFSNLNAARDSATADVEDFYIAGNIDRPNTSVIQKSTIANFPGRALTGIAIHPDNPDRVVFTLGNYGNQTYVYYSANATSASPNFVAKQGDLPRAPVYSASFNYQDPAGTQVLLGTEYGVYVTDDISAGLPTYVAENTGMARVAVFDIKQQKTIRYDLKDPWFDVEGTFYIGTHGRGFFRSGTAEQPISIEENNIGDVTAPKEGLNIFPNPATTEVKVNLNLTNRSDIQISIRDLSGKLVKSIKLDRVAVDVNEVPLDVSRLKAGTYIVSLQINNTIKSGKLLIAK